jgi:hypothetical protein
VGERCARVICREVYAITSVNLPVDVAWDDVRAAVAVSTGISGSGTIAGDDD